MDVVLDSDEALLAGLRLAVLKTGGPVVVRAEPDVRDRILALAKVNGLLPFLQEPERQKAPQSHKAVAASPEPSNDAPPASVDQTVNDAPPVAADWRQIEPSDLQASSTPPSAEIVPLPSDEPSPVLEAPLATPAENAAAPSSPPRFNVGEGRQSGGAAQQLVRDHLRKEAERKSEPEAKGVERSVDPDTRAEARPTRTLDPEQTRTKDGEGARRQTPARSPQPEDKPRRSPGRGPNDLDDLPPGWPPSRGSSRG